MNHKKEFLDLYRSRIPDSVYAQIVNMTAAYTFDYILYTGSGKVLDSHRKTLVKIECQTPEYNQALEFYLL